MKNHALMIALIATTSGTYAATQVVTMGDNNQTTSTSAITLGHDNKSSFQGVVIGNNNEGGDQSISIGSYSKAVERSIAIGRDAETTSDESIALGNNTEAGRWGSISIGDRAVSGIDIMDDSDFQKVISAGKAPGAATEGASVAIGQASTAAGQFSVAVGTSYTATNANGATAIGAGAVVTNDNSVALGALSIAGKDEVREGTSYASGESINKKSGVVSVGSKNNERVITNVKGGTDDHDATNVMQLKAVENRVTNQFNNQINNLDGRLSKLDKRLDRGLASSAALSGLFQPYNIDKFNLTVGVGGYRSESALAIGTGYRFNESVAAKGGVSTSMNDSSSLMYNASMNFEW